MEQEGYKEALCLALTALNRRFLSEKELRDKLEQKEVEPCVIEEVLAYLKKMRYVDDVRLANQVAAYYKKTKKYGIHYVRQKLKQRGLPVDELLQDEETELEQAVYLIRKKYGTVYDLKNKQKMYRYLQYRGFSGDLIYQAIGKISDELTES